jgi:hypothetical protein
LRIEICVAESAEADTEREGSERNARALPRDEESARERDLRGRVAMIG